MPLFKATLPHGYASLGNLQQRLREAGGDYALLAKPTHFDKVCYILDLLYNNTIYDRSATKESYKILNSRILSNLFGCPYDRQIINFLIAHGIVESDDSYQVGVESKGYRLTEDYRYDSAICVYNQDSKFVLKLTQRSWERMNDTERFLWNQLRVVTIRYQEALLYLLYSSDLLYILCTIKPYLKEENNWGFDAIMNALEEVDNEKLRESIRDKFISIHKIQIGQFFFTRDDVGQRVHTNITNLWGEFRQFIKLDGCEDLVNVDLKNSQLLFSCISIRDYYRKKNQVMPTDVKRWLAMCQSGKAYEQLHQIFYGTKLNPKQRSDFKKKFFGAIFYCKVNVMRNTPEGKAFKKEFPSVFEYIIHMKKKNYNNFAIQMQLLESQLIIGQLCHWMQQELIPVLSIHDSCLVKTEDVYKVKLEFEKQIKALKIDAKIKLEYMTIKAQTIYESILKQQETNFESFNMEIGLERFEDTPPSPRVELGEKIKVTPRLVHEVNMMLNNYQPINKSKAKSEFEKSLDELVELLAS